MSENQPSGNKPANNNRRHHHHNQKRRPQVQGGGQQTQGHVNSNSEGNKGPAAGAPTGGNNQRRRHGRNHHNRPRNPNNAPSAGQPQQGTSLDRIYEKYLNLLDQHLIARRKYHDLFFRADPAQKNKLERSFYNTLKDVRDFEDKLTPDLREQFEKRNNGLKTDNIYTTNHEIGLEGDTPPAQSEWHDPHFLQSQKVADYSDDKEESVGTADDYLKYKNLY